MTVNKVGLENAQNETKYCKNERLATLYSKNTAIISTHVHVQCSSCTERTSTAQLTVHYLESKTFPALVYQVLF